MFCVVQTMQRKKPDTHGDYQEYEVSRMTMQFQDGRTKTHYSYYPKYEAGQFDRPHREAYKISIHESRREGGQMVKKQCAIGTIGYYDLAQWGLYDYMDRGISHAVDVFGVDYETFSSYSVPSASTYTDDDRIILKQFYRSLSKLYHPDVAGEGSTAAMQVLNRLKSEWGV